MMQGRYAHQGRGLSLVVLGLMITASPCAAAMAQAQDAPVITQTGMSDKAARKKGSRPKDDPEIIVTGVLGATKARKANSSVAVLSSEDMSKFTPVSASDMLRDMPGVVVDPNEGVARGMIYTRGMSIGSDLPTTGNFWVSMLEDGLPILPVRYNGMQDGNFYRADISTNRVEAVRGGSSGVSVSTSAGGVFNFMSAPIRNGTAIQMRLGAEGEQTHLSWRQIDFIHGHVNKEGNFGYSIAGFLRGSNGPAGKGLSYDLNSGAQIKARMFRSMSPPMAGGAISI
jgi:outer membrane receptor for Fe3+-dicitrate